MTHSHLHTVLVLGALTGVFAAPACAGMASVDHRPCPCASGYTCCDSENVCVANGEKCAAAQPITTRDDGGPRTDGGATTLPTPPTKCDAFAGLNRSDIWCGAAKGGLSHWDGTSWKSVDVPLPAGNGTLYASGLGAAGDGAAYYATDFGVARVHADGKSEDLTPTDFVQTQVVAVAKTGDTAYLGFGDHFYRLEKDAFVHVDPAGGDINGIDGIDGTPWVWSEQTVTHAVPGGQTVSPVYWPHNKHAIGGGVFWTMPGFAGTGVGRYCPEWCHPGAEPFHAAIDTPWEVWKVNDTTSEVVKIAPDVPRDGSVAYEGRGVRTARNGHLVLVGCLTDQKGSAATVAHEWDGAALGPKRVLTGVACPSVESEGISRTLLDGTWVFAAGGSFSLVDPT